MQISQGITNLIHPGYHLFFDQGLANSIQDGLQIISFDEIHHQVLALRRYGEIIGNAGQVRMAQVSQHPGLAFELALGFFPIIQVFFEGAKRFQAQILGAINCAKTTLTKLFDNAIALLYGLAGL
jgi:hypothetical protein